jgi:hypothetical protein
MAFEIKKMPRANQQIPEAADGVAVANITKEIARLENIIQSSDVAGFPTGIVLIMRIPKSWKA